MRFKKQIHIRLKNKTRMPVGRTVLVAIEVCVLEGRHRYQRGGTAIRGAAQISKLVKKRATQGHISVLSNSPRKTVVFFQLVFASTLASCSQIYYKGRHYCVHPILSQLTVLTNTSKNKTQTC